MAQIKLKFTNVAILNILLANAKFNNEISHLNPVFIEPDVLLLLDNNFENSNLDSEVIVLQPITYALKQLIFPLTPFVINYINPYPNQFKHGLIHDTEILLESSIIGQG